jgi:hypothetical protein
MARYAIMSFSFRNDRMAWSICAASVWPFLSTSLKARSAVSFQCHLSSNASICARACSPVGALNRTL